MPARPHQLTQANAGGDHEMDEGNPAEEGRCDDDRRFDGEGHVDQPTRSLPDFDSVVS